jgi:uncharacterized protein YndB with AHSA1/START domain
MLQQLLYRGPDIEALQDQYAKRGRIDDRAPVTTSYEIVIDAPVERVWDLLGNPAGWPSFDPRIHDVHIDAGVRAAEGVPFTWSNGRARMRSSFALVDPGREITWTGVSSGFKVVHRHLLEATADGGTRVRCEESMAGPFLVLFFNGAKLRAALEQWLTALKTAAESTA